MLIRHWRDQVKMEYDGYLCTRCMQYQYQRYEEAGVCIFHFDSIRFLPIIPFGMLF